MAILTGHHSPIASISVHASGRYALTSSSDEAHLWDLDTFDRKRKLNVKEEVGIVSVSSFYYNLKKFDLRVREVQSCRYKRVSLT